MLECWNVGIMGYGEMVKWVTCREPQGCAIGKIQIDKEFQDLYKEKLPLKTNIPKFHHSLIPRARQKRLCLNKLF